MHVTYTNDPESVLADAGAYLAASPVLNSVVLTLLRERARQPSPGRYWIARQDDGSAAGVALQSPLEYALNLSPMEPVAARALATSIAAEGCVVPGVSGDATTAAAFVGRWTECKKSSATPVHGRRIYEIREVTRGRSQPVRLAGADDRALIVEWIRGFWNDIGEAGGDPTAMVECRLRDGRFWLLDGDEGPASLACCSEPAEGVVRVQIVYTPPPLRGAGNAEACVRDVSRRVLAAGNRCILHTDLANATSNSVFRRVGYSAVAEALGYRLD